MSDEYKKKIGVPESHALNMVVSGRNEKAKTLIPMNVKS